MDSSIQLKAYETVFILGLQNINVLNKYDDILQPEVIDDEKIYYIHNVMNMFVKKYKKKNWTSEMQMSYINMQLGLLHNTLKDLVNIDPSEIDGRWVKSIRTLLGFSQEDFVKLIKAKNTNPSILSQDRICRIENGTCELYFRDVIQILSVLNCQLKIYTNNERN